MENVKAAMENAGSAGKAEAINYQSVKQKFQSYLKHPGSFAVSDAEHLLQECIQ